MTNDEIRAKLERFDGIVSQYAEDIKNFQSDVEGSMRELDTAMDRLSAAWSSELYTAFANKMSERQSNIRNCLHRAQRLETKLNTIADKMAYQLDQLKAAGKDA